MSQGIVTSATDVGVLQLSRDTQIYELYLDHFKTRKSLGSMTRKLSVTESRNSDHRTGTVSLRNSRTSSANSLYFEWHLLWVMYLCMTPHNRSIGFRCGQ